MGGTTNLKKSLVISVFLVGIHCTIAAGEVVYVDDDALLGGDGQTWGTAYKYLQDALADANVSGDDIWVAEGTYYPDEGEAANVDPNDRTETFQLIDGVEIYGGFAGGESSLDERDWGTNETILSGDINTTGDNDNCYHVVTSSGCDLNTVLDGFTITAGNANGTGSNGYGGGMYNHTSNAVVVNCTFCDNAADHLGGGMYNFESDMEVTDCNFVSNHADYGGGIYNSYGYPKIAYCVFRGNHAYLRGGGGGIHNRYSDAVITDCKFIKNVADEESLDCLHCPDGGGIYNYHSSSIITNCTFYSNKAGSSGGGIFTYGSDLEVVNCTFINNHAGSGGGVNNLSCNLTLTGCIFSANSAYWGGALHNFDDSNTTINNCTLNRNSATKEGNGIACWSFNQSASSVLQINNCILWDGDDEIWNDNDSIIIISYSDVQGGWSGTGNMGADPMFIDADGLDDVFGTEDDDLRLSPDSNCIDAGDNSASNLPATDMDGHPRIIDGDCNDTEVVDMGAYEFNYAYISDFDYNCEVDFGDFAILGLAWLTEPPDENWNQFCDISIPADNKIDWADVEVLSDNWLAGH